MPVLSEIFVYPIKSCAGIPLTRAVLLETGLEYDRNWMVTDPSGQMLTQRAHLRMALIRTAFDQDDLVIDAISSSMRPACRRCARSCAPSARRCDDHSRHRLARYLDALDTGEATARWLTECLGTPARLVHFSPATKRLVSQKWTAPLVTHTRFADGFPLFVLGQASLDDLNARLSTKGAPGIPMNRFRPNFVIGGLDAYEEDFVGDMQIGDAQLRLVKLCARCPVPTIGQLTGAPHPEWPHEPLDTMSGYRASEQMDGQLTFGKNAVVVEGEGIVLEVG